MSANPIGARYDANQSVSQGENVLKQDQLYHMVLHLPVVLAAVSEAVQNILGAEFGRNPLLIPNGVDCERFFPGPRAHLQPSLVISAPPLKGNASAPLFWNLPSHSYLTLPALLFQPKLRLARSGTAK